MVLKSYLLSLSVNRIFLGVPLSKMLFIVFEWFRLKVFIFMREREIVLKKFFYFSQFWIYFKKICSNINILMDLNFYLSIQLLQNWVVKIIPISLSNLNKYQFVTINYIILKLKQNIYLFLIHYFIKLCYMTPIIIFFFFFIVSLYYKLVYGLPNNTVIIELEPNNIIMSKINFLNSKQIAYIYLYKLFEISSNFFDMFLIYFDCSFLSNELFIFTDLVIDDNLSLTDWRHIHDIIGGKIVYYVFLFYTKFFYIILCYYNIIVNFLHKHKEYVFTLLDFCFYFNINCLLTEFEIELLLKTWFERVLLKEQLFEIPINSTQISSNNITSSVVDASEKVVVNPYWEEFETYFWGGLVAFIVVSFVLSCFGDFSHGMPKISWENARYVRRANWLTLL